MIPSLPFGLRHAAPVGVLLVVAFLIAACNGLVPQNPRTGSNPHTGPSAHKGKKYGWGLPKGDPAPDPTEQNVFEDVRGGDCDSAQGELHDHWFEFASPRSVVLAQAAIDFCQAYRDGSAERPNTTYVEQGTQMFLRARRYGWKGLRQPSDPVPVSCAQRASTTSRCRV
jgi:hypothetical protein